MSGSGVTIVGEEVNVSTGGTPGAEHDGEDQTHEDKEPAAPRQHDPNRKLFVLLHHPRLNRVVIVSSRSSLWMEASGGMVIKGGVECPQANAIEGVYGIAHSRRAAMALWDSISAYHAWKFGARWCGFEKGPPPKVRGGRIGAEKAEA